MSNQIKLLVILASVHLSRAIIGGEPASLFHWPSYAIIKYRSNHYCGGSMFYPHWIVTAAQCIDPNYVDKIWIDGVATGISNLDEASSGNFVHQADLYVKGHPSFAVDRSGVAINDIAVVRLPSSTPMTTNSHDIPLTKSKDVQSYASCYTAGFGMSNIDVYVRELELSESFHQIRTIFEVEQIVVPLNECMLALQNQLHYKTSLDDSTHLCARGAQEKSGPTYGDFGSPLICDEYQVGVASLSCYAPNISSYLYTVYARIDKYRPWIESVVVNNPELVSSRQSRLPQAQSDAIAQEEYKNAPETGEPVGYYPPRRDRKQMHEVVAEGKSIKDIYQERVDNLANCVTNIDPEQNILCSLIFLVVFYLKN